MAKAIIDPTELRRFAQRLKQFNSDLQNQVASLQTQFQNLSSTWRDQEHQKFAESFTQTMQVIGRFIDAADAHIPFLIRKAERAEDYLEQR